MKLFVLFTGEYEARTIHSIHSSKEEAMAVDERVRRDWHDKDGPADIDEHDLDPAMCNICGYEQHWHITHPDTWKHAFEPRQCPPTAGGSQE